MISYNIMKKVNADAPDQFELVGRGHSGNGNDALYATYDSLEKAVIETKNNLDHYSKHGYEFVAKTLSETEWVISHVDSASARRMLVNLFKLGGRSREQEIKKHCGLDSKLPQEIIDVFPSASLSWVDTVFGLELNLLIADRSVVFEEDLVPGADNIFVQWWFAAAAPIDFPDLRIDPHPRESSMIRFITDTTATYVRFAMYGFNASEEMKAFWYGTYNRPELAFEHVISGIAPDTQDVLTMTALMVEKMSLIYNREPVCIDIENGMQEGNVRLTFTGMSKLMVARLIADIENDDFIFVSQKLEHGLTLDVQMPSIVFENLIFVAQPKMEMEVPEGVQEVSSVSELIESIKIDLTEAQNNPTESHFRAYVGAAPVQIDSQDFDDYFDDVEEYPKDIAFDPLPIGTRYDYVSSQFLNGFIPYVKPIDTVVIDRYVMSDELLPRDEDDLLPQIYDDGKWQRMEGPITKHDLIFQLIQSNRGRITDLKHFQDDVLMLARPHTDNTPDHGRMYFYFWFDHDVSDCTIGRFVTEEPEETVRAKFMAHVKARAKRLSSTGGIYIIPDGVLDGWLSF